MTTRIFRASFCVGISALAASLLLVMGILYDYYEVRLLTELKSEWSYVAQGIELNGSLFLKALDQGTTRVTWIDSDGVVLFDTSAEKSAMENHADRAEFQQAMTSDSGESSRVSNTLGEKTLYFAKRLGDGTVLRVSSRQDSAVTLMLGLSLPILWVITLALVLSAILSYRVSKRIVKPINEIDLEHPDWNQVYDELAPLLVKINRQNRVIAQQMGELGRRQQEFKAITENMNEGFLIVDRMTNVLSYNTSALRLLGVQPSGEHQSILTLNRSEHFRRAVETALAGHHGEELLRLNGRCYQVISNSVSDDGHITGAVIVILDVTEKEDGERLRREFTANVSHELKTPLTSISGFAEIMQSGMVAQADVPRFAGNIYSEAQRLIALVGDIIKLSRLDEGAYALEKKPVDLLRLSGEVIDRLSPEAKRHDVSLQLDGDSCEIQGVRPVLDEMIYNLCENAIKYNRPGGSVRVSVTPDSKGVCVRVADTGIGIPAADQSRVFERFYRVDKSHSKEIGGTGLGLSIVKHGGILHGAEITLESKEQVGTTVTIRFPRNHTN